MVPMGNWVCAIIDQMAQTNPMSTETPEEVVVEPTEVDLTTKGRFVKWFLTIWPELDMEVLEETLNENCKWWVIQRERCPTTERLHYHFVCHLKEALTFGGLKRLLDIEGTGTAKSFKLWGGEGGLQRVIKYCSKAETRVEGPWSGGDLPNKRRRAGEVIVEMIEGGSTNRDIAKMFPLQARMLNDIRDALDMNTVMRDRDAPPTVWFVHGEPGVGKTRKFFDMVNDMKEVHILNTPPSSGTWFFNGYHQQTIALFDDANPPTERNIVQWLRVLDRYPLRVDTKGGSIQFNSPIIGITTNLTWDEWTAFLVPGHKAALRRRISHIEHMAAAPQSQEGASPPTEQP